MILPDIIIDAGCNLLKNTWGSKIERAVVRAVSARCLTLEHRLRLPSAQLPFVLLRNNSAKKDLSNRADMRLNTLLNPRSVALFGASNQGLAGTVTSNLLRSSRDEVFLITNDTNLPHGHCAYRGVDELPITPDLAVICTSAESAADALDQAGGNGVKTAVVITPDPQGSDPDTSLKRSLHRVAQSHGSRFLGPTSAGVCMPILRLNATCFDGQVASGKLALVSQSASIAAGAVHWAASQGVGLSRIVSMGDEADISVDEILDYLAADVTTTGILLCLRSPKRGRAFVSSARAAARVKPILVLRPHDRTSLQLGETIVGRDQVFDSAFRRIGVLPVNDTSEWFDAAAALAGARRPRAGKLAIVAKGEGAARLAAALIEAERLLATLQNRTIEALQPLVSSPVATNPIVFDRNVTSKHYAAALSALSEDENVCAVLIIHSPPAAGFNSKQALHFLAEAASTTTLEVLICWFGAALDNEMRSALAAANVTLYDTPEKAARAFIYLAKHRRNQNEMRQIPIARRQQFIVEPTGSAESALRPLLLSEEKESADFLKAFGVVCQAISANRDVLDEEAGSAVLRAYDLQAAEQTGRTVLPLPASISIGNDPAFGRVILVDVAGHREVLLPPLNQELTRDVATRAQSALQACGVTIDAEAIQSTLIRLANMTVELPEISMLQGKAAVSSDGAFLIPAAHIWVAAPSAQDSHLSIHPYPVGLEERVRTKRNEEILIRPMRLEDIRLYRKMLESIPADDLFFLLLQRYW